MSVLEKIVQAEKEASALLLASQQKATLLIENAHAELELLKINKAKEVSAALSVYGEEMNKAIALFSKSIIAEKEKVIAAINESAKTRKQKVVDEIFKAITEL